MSNQKYYVRLSNGMELCSIDDQELSYVTQAVQDKLSVFFGALFVAFSVL